MLTQLKLNPSCTFEELTLKGELLKIRRWGRFENARALLLLVHGLGAESSWFEAAAREFAARGFFVLAYDQRGFGSRSDAAFNSYKDWLDDLRFIVQHLRNTYDGLPLFLLGNSMGALVVMAAAAAVTVDGIVLCSPGFDGHPQAFTLNYRIKSVLSAFLTPWRAVPLPYQMELVTRDLSARAFLAENAPTKPTVSAGLLLELLKLSRRVLAGLKEGQAPVLMITAGQDRVVNNEISKKLFERLLVPSKKHVCLQEAWHDLMFDPLMDEVADEFAQWQSTLATKPARS